MRAMRRYLAIPFCMVLATQMLGYAARRGSAPLRRAKPPEWDASVRDVYFDDVREKLVGDRPDYSSSVAATPQDDRSPKSTGGEPTAGSGFSWSKIIAPTTIEDEIKAQKLLVDNTVTTPGKFKSGGNREAQKQFSTIAVMFALAAQHDQEVRWRGDAAGLRELFSRAGFNCKVGTDASYNEAKARTLDLADLLRGDRPPIPTADRTAVWEKVAWRPMLMQRMEESLQKRIGPALANEREFSKSAERVYHEAQILAALAEIIQHESYEFADDEDYRGLARRMGVAAAEIAAAAKAADYAKARAAAGETSKSCSECHEDYRA